MSVMTPGRAMMALGAGHTAWGALAYRHGLRAIARAGVVDSVGDGLFAREHAHGERAAAFWFTFVGPVVWLLGRLVQASDEAGDRRALTTAGLGVTAVSATGLAVMPRSGFWAGTAVGVWLLRTGRRR